MSTHPPLLLIHGLIGSLRELVPVLRSHGIVAYAPDLLGYGELQSTEVDNIGLHQQVAHLVAWLDDRGLPLVNVLGHSVGGAISMLLAHTHPERVASIISVEGNFGLADAFWSAGVARMSGEEVEAMMNEFRSDPEAWLGRSGIEPEPGYVAVAERLLANQPPSTVQATARSVVAVTGSPEYDQVMRAVFAGSAPVHLLAGERSRKGWSVPDWALAACASDTLLPGGHLMMIEHPEPFAAIVAKIA